jgi:group I intron endonuclease
LNRGIYVIQNLINHKVYIGSARNIKARWSLHVWKLSRQLHENEHLQRAWVKYGKKNFIFWKLEDIQEINQLVGREQFYLDLFQNYSFGIYNICLTAYSSLGTQHTLEALQKLIKAQTGKIHSVETRQRMSLSHLGKRSGLKHSEETKRKMSASRRKRVGFKHSEDAKRNMSEARHRYFANIRESAL